MHNSYSLRRAVAVLHGVVTILALTGAPALQAAPPAGRIVVDANAE